MEAPTPTEIYARAEAEGRRRLDMGLLEQVATAFVAGVTIMFGVVALGISIGLVERELGTGVAKIIGALAFGLGMVFLVVGRSELFTENLFDPVAAAIDEGGGAWRRLVRLWATTLVLNLVGGTVILMIISVDGALPADAGDALVEVAKEMAAKRPTATLARALLAGALITLLSYMLKATNTVAGRILVAYLVGFFLALGPFDHVVVSALHLLAGVVLSDAVHLRDLAPIIGLSTVGNLVGGLLLITLTHTAQVKGAGSTR